MKRGVIWVLSGIAMMVLTLGFEGSFPFHFTNGNKDGNAHPDADSYSHANFQPAT